MALTFASTFLASGAAAWWGWLLLGMAIVAGIASGVLIKRERDSPAVIQPVQGGAGEQQIASGQGAKISINADRGSAAAFHMGEVHIGERRYRGKRKES